MNSLVYQQIRDIYAHNQVASGINRKPTILFICTAKDLVKGTQKLF